MQKALFLTCLPKALCHSGFRSLKLPHGCTWGEPAFINETKKQRVSSFLYNWLNSFLELTHHQTHLLWPCTATCPATAGCNNRLWVILSLIHGTFGGIVWGIKTLTCQIQADGHLPTLKTAFPVKQANICILLLQHSKYYKQQPVKNDLNCSKEPLDSFLAFGLLK